MQIRLAEQIKKLRKREGISQAELAKAIGTSKSFFGEVETGKSSVSIETLVLLAQYFDVTTDFLIGYKD